MNLRSLPNEPGVYFLYKGDACVYVGSTVRIRQRITSHQHRGEFDKVDFLLCDVDKLNETEEHYIAKLLPLGTLLNKETKAKGNRSNKITKILAFRVKRIFANQIRELSRKEHRPIGNMAYVLIKEALKARGVQFWGEKWKPK